MSHLHQNDSGYAVCDICGETLPATATFCTNCGGRKISRHDQPERELPLQEYTEYHTHAQNRRVVSAHHYTSYSANDQGFLVNIPPEEYEEDYSEEYSEPYENEYEEDGYDEDEYIPAPAPTPSSVRIMAVTGFLTAVFAVALVGLVISLFPASDEVSSETQTPVSSVADVSSAVSSEKTVVHKLPEEIQDGSYEVFTVEGNTFGAVAASSYIDENLTHGSTEQAFDGEVITCWQDGVKGYGEGEWLIAFNPDKSAVTVSSITVYNGYQNTKYNSKSKDMFKINSRVSDFTLEFDDGTTESFTLADNKDAQTFQFSQRETCYVRFIIDGAYKGKKYKDTCISEIIYK